MYEYEETFRPERMTFSELRRMYSYFHFAWKLERLPDGNIAVNGSDWPFIERSYHGPSGSVGVSSVYATVSTAGGRVRVLEYTDSYENYSW
jgi:hypothetical protein